MCSVFKFLWLPPKLSLIAFFFPIQDHEWHLFSSFSLLHSRTVPWSLFHDIGILGAFLKRTGTLFDEMSLYLGLSSSWFRFCIFGRTCKIEVICPSQDIPHQEAPGMSLSHLGNVKFDLFKVGAQQVSPPTKVHVPPPRLWKWITFCAKIHCVPISCYLSNSYPIRF